ncbi:CIA30 family protein [Hyunsoonleella sp. 2307UL5-6]|uniref:CIA30 family protein n=1 Tax=Hyunsoonleella sp. 2307UL5-6 TaxID=3384768 RepID=UPI0039BD09B4
MQTPSIFDFNTTTIDNWIIIDDAVMGGVSSGAFKLDDQGNGLFYGTISLENNGGFSSVRNRSKTINVTGFSKITLRFKGDGKRYQFRVKHNVNDKHSYVTHFMTSGIWETIEINLTDLQPKFRGKHLDLPNFSHDTIAEIGFLFANKKAEPFELLIDSITLQ